MQRFVRVIPLLLEVTLVLVLTACGTDTANDAVLDVTPASRAAVKHVLIDAHTVTQVGDGNSLTLDLTAPGASYLFDPSGGAIDFSRIILLLAVGREVPMAQLVNPPPKTPDGEQLDVSERFVVLPGAFGSLQYVPYRGALTPAAICPCQGKGKTCGVECGGQKTT